MRFGRWWRRLYATTISAYLDAGYVWTVIYRKMKAVEEEEEWKLGSGRQGAGLVF